jgi:DHA1 family multidrug resistance protein-like MFS transporter
MWAGFFMVIPLISIHYVDQMGWAAASIGVVLAVRQLTQQGLTPISGMLADRFGAKGLICVGILLRVAGFASMAWADTFELLLLSAILAALGGAMFESPKSAAIAALTDESNRTRFYSLAGVVSGLGLTIGTQVGVLLLDYDFAWVALGAAGTFFMTFLVTLFFLPPVRVSTGEAGDKITAGFRLALHDRPFVLLTIFLMGFWFIWVQLSISLPLAALEKGGSTDAVGWVYAINAVMSIVLQYPLLRLASRWLSPMPILVLGITIMSSGLGAIALAWNVWAFLGCVVLYALGSLLAMPSQQTVTANLANPAALGSYYGVNSLALALGGGLGNLCGGLLYDVGKASGFQELPWLVFLGVGLMSAAGIWRLHVSLRTAEQSSVVHSQQATVS